MKGNDDDALEALFIVEWYASSLNDSLRTDPARKEDALEEVMELLNASKLSQNARAAVVRVVLTVLRCLCDARRAEEEAKARVSSARKNVAVKIVVSVVCLIFAFVALVFRAYQAATFAIGCFVAILYPKLESWIRALLASRFIQKQEKGAN